MPRSELPVRAELKVGEGRKVLVQDPADDDVVVGAPGSAEPRPTPRQGPLEHQVAVGDAERRRAGELPPSRPVPYHEQGRQPVSVLGAEAAGCQGEIGDGLRVEGAHQTEEPVGVMDLDAVHQGEVLIRRATAHGQEAAEVRRGGHPRQRRERPEDVVHRAGGFEHLFRSDPRRGGTLQLRRLGGHLDRLFLERARQQLDQERARPCESYRVLEVTRRRGRRRARGRGNRKLERTVFACGGRPAARSDRSAGNGEPCHAVHDPPGDFPGLRRRLPGRRSGLLGNPWGAGHRARGEGNGYPGSRESGGGLAHSLGSLARVDVPHGRGLRSPAAKRLH